MAYLLEGDPLIELSDREELKLDELKVPKLSDKGNLSFTVTIDSKDQPDIEKMCKKNPRALHHVRGIVLSCTNSTKSNSFSSHNDKTAPKTYVISVLFGDASE